jgi:hypothetical protein
MEIISIKIPESKLLNISRMFPELANKLSSIISWGINRTLQPAKTQINREMRKTLNIKAAYLNKYIDIERATRQKWYGRVMLSTERITLMDFDAKVQMGERWIVKSGQDFASPETGPIGISYKIKKGGKREIIKSAFIATMKSGHQGVFKRTGKSRLPIQEKFGPSIGLVFDRAKTVVRQVTQTAMSNLDKNIDAQVKYLLSRRAAG